MSDKKKKYPDSLIITNATQPIADYLMDTWWKWWNEAKPVQRSKLKETPT